MQRSSGIRPGPMGVMKRVPRMPTPWRERLMSIRAARFAGAVLVVGWAIVQYEGSRRPRIPEAEALAPTGDGPNGVEIERKFLVDELPGALGSYPSEEIEQGYLAIDGEVEVRVRRRGGDATQITLKAGSGESRLEEEFEID